MIRRTLSTMLLWCAGVLFALAIFVRHGFTDGAAIIDRGAKLIDSLTTEQTP